jgi:hypothetical protein
MCPRASSWPRRGAGRNATETATTVAKSAVDPIMSRLQRGPPQSPGRGLGEIRIERVWN